MSEYNLSEFYLINNIVEEIEFDLMRSKKSSKGKRWPSVSRALSSRRRVDSGSQSAGERPECLRSQRTLPM
jgi:hypothetical protein